MPQTWDHLDTRLATETRARLRAVLCDQEIRLVSCVYWRNAAPWEIEWRTCPDTFLLFPTRGAFRVYLQEKGGLGRLVRPGEYVVLSEGRGHRVLIAEEHGRRLEQVSIHAQMADRWGRPLAARLPAPFGRLRDPRGQLGDLRDIVALLHTEPEAGHVYGECFLRKLRADRVRDEAGFTLDSPGGDPRIGMALDEMQRRLASPLLSIEELAAYVELSPVQFRKLFARAMGRGPKTHLQQLRLQRAAKLMRRGGGSVQSVAEECGFASSHYFHLVFRAAYGVTPGEYRVQSSP